MGLCNVYYDITQASNIPFFILILSIPVCYGLLHQSTFSCLLLLKIQKEGVKIFNFKQITRNFLYFAVGFIASFLTVVLTFSVTKGAYSHIKFGHQQLKLRTPEKYVHSLKSKDLLSYQLYQG